MMIDARVAARVEQTDRFIAEFREMVEATAVDPCGPCADVQRRALRRIADTLDAVPYATMCNIATLDAATAGLLLEVIELRLTYVGCFPTLDFVNAEAFFSAFQPVIDKALRRLLQ
jgi:hypothetical protein